MHRDYKYMESWEAVRLAKELSGFTTSQIAARSGISEPMIKRYLERGDGNYNQALDKIPALCRGFGNKVLLHWAEAQIDQEEECPPAESRADVFTAVARVCAIVGDVQRVLANTQQTGIGPHEARELRSHLDDVVAECKVAKGSIAHMAEHKDITTCVPLPSIATDVSEGQGFAAFIKRIFKGGSHD